MATNDELLRELMIKPENFMTEVIDPTIGLEYKNSVNLQERNLMLSKLFQA